MRSMSFLALMALLATGSAIGPARANMCQAGPLSCATAMPEGGYCECTSRGATESGTSVARATGRRSTNSTAGGCGVNPNAPGCR